MNWAEHFRVLHRLTGKMHWTLKIVGMPRCMVSYSPGWGDLAWDLVYHQEPPLVLGLWDGDDGLNVELNQDHRCWEIVS